MAAVVWSSLRACVFLAAAIVFFVHGNSLKPGSDPQLQADEPTVTVVTTDTRFAGSVNMSLFASGQQNQLYNLKLTITPAAPVSPSTPVEVSFGNVPHPIPGLQTGIVSSAQSGNEYFKVLLPDRDDNGHADVHGHVHVGAAVRRQCTKGGRLRVAFPTFTGETPGSQFSDTGVRIPREASPPDRTRPSARALAAAPPGLGGPCRSCKPGRARSPPAVSASSRATST